MQFLSHSAQIRMLLIHLCLSEFRLQKYHEIVKPCTENKMSGIPFQRDNKHAVIVWGRGHGENVAVNGYEFIVAVIISISNCSGVCMWVLL